MTIENDDHNFIGSFFAKTLGIVAKVGVDRLMIGSINIPDVVGGVVEAFVEDGVSTVLHMRAKKRISNSFKYADERKKYLEDTGYTVRTDILLNDENYTVKDEVIEDLFKKVMNQHQEKKIKYITNAAIGYFYEKGDIKYTPEFVFNAMKIAENLTFQQMCLLNLFSKGIYRDSLRYEEHEGEYEYSDAQYNVYTEIFELVRLGLLCCVNEEVIDNWNNMNHWEVDQVHTIDDIIPQRMVPTYFGSSYIFLLGLNEIEDEEIQRVIKNGDLTSILSQSY